nr:DUF5681 domain-containing protein [Nitrosomonas nitrosa]
MANKIGYRKPPAHSRFKKGQSGNPSGRRKGSRNLATVLERELAQRVTIVEGGRKMRLTKQEVVVKSAINKAMKGDGRAFNTIMTLIARAFGIEPQARPDQPPTEEEQVLYESIKARLREEMKSMAGEGAFDPDVDPAFLR